MFFYRLWLVHLKYNGDNRRVQIQEPKYPDSDVCPGSWEVVRIAPGRYEEPVVKVGIVFDNRQRPETTGYYCSSCFRPARGAWIETLLVPNRISGLVLSPRTRGVD